MSTIKINPFGVDSSSSDVNKWSWLFEALAVEGLTLDDKDIAALQQKLDTTPLKSVFEIAEYEQDRFYQNYEMKLRGWTAEIYRAARRVVVRHEHESLLGAIHDGYAALEQELAVTSDAGKAPALTFQGLFQENWSAFCEPNQIVDWGSPAAYLLALYRMVGHFQSTSNATPMSLENSPLMKRRADLLGVRLSTEQLQHEQRALTLANPLLEKAIVHADDLSEGALYQILAKTFYPPSLPFHLPYAQVTLALQETRSSLGDIVRQMDIEVPFSQNKSRRPIMRAYLGLSPSQQQLLLENGDEAVPSQHMGELSLHTEQGVKVSDFCRATELGRTALDQLLGLGELAQKNKKKGSNYGTRYIQGKEEQHIEITELEGVETLICSSTQRIRMSRMIRLQRWLTMPFDLLDTLICACADNGDKDLESAAEQGSPINSDAQPRETEGHILLSSSRRAGRDLLEREGSSRKTDNAPTINDQTLDLLGLFRYLHREYQLEPEAFTKLLVAGPLSSAIKQLFTRLGLTIDEVEMLGGLLNNDQGSNSNAERTKVDSIFALVSAAQWLKQQHLTVAVLLPLLNPRPTLISEAPIIAFFEGLGEQVQPLLLSKNSFKEVELPKDFDENTWPAFLAELEGLEDSKKLCGVIRPQGPDTQASTYMNIWAQESFKAIVEQLKLAQEQTVTQAIARFCAVSPDLAPCLLRLASVPAHDVLSLALQFKASKKGPLDGTSDRKALTRQAIEWTHSLARYSSAFSLFGISPAGANAWKDHPDWFGCEQPELSLYNLYQLSQYTNLLSKIPATEMQVLDYLEKTSKGSFESGMKEASWLLSGNKIEAYWQHWELGLVREDLKNTLERDQTIREISSLNEEIAVHQQEIRDGNALLQSVLAKFEAEVETSRTEVNIRLKDDLKSITNKADAACGESDRTLDSGFNAGDFNSLTIPISNRTRVLAQKKNAARQLIIRDQIQAESAVKEDHSRAVRDLQDKYQSKTAEYKHTNAETVAGCTAKIEILLARRKALKVKPRNETALPHNVPQLSMLKRWQQLAQQTELPELTLLELAELVADPTVESYSLWQFLANQVVTTLGDAAQAN